MKPYTPPSNQKIKLHKTFIMINQRIFHLLILFALFSGVAVAQSELPTEQVDIIKNFNAKLLDAERQTVKPELPPLDTTTRRMNYNIIDRTLDVEYLPPKIRPLAMRGDALAQAYNGYLKAGAGLPGSFLVDGAYNLLSNNNFDLGINLLHHSANNNGKVENQRFSDNHIGLNGTYYLEQGVAVNGQLNYANDRVFFYGYNDLPDSLSFDQDDVKQRFSLFSASGQVFNGERTVADFNYKAGFDFYLLQDNYAAKETGFKVDLGGTKWFNEKHALRINLITDFTNFSDTAKQTLHNFYLQPNFTFHGDNFKIKAGFNVVSHEDEFSFFPDLELSAVVLPGLVTAFVGADGSLRKNNFRTLTEYNPFLTSRPMIENTRYYNFYGGAKGNVAGLFDYQGKVSYKTTDNLALFLSNEQDIPRFDVVYDTVNIFSISGMVGAPLFEGFELSGTIAQNFYSTSSEEKAWHLPSLSVNATAQYTTLDDKLIFRAELFLENGVPFKAEDGKADNLNTLFDVSVGAEYFVTENIGVFGQLNNLADNKRQRWRHYPVFGLNALFGVTARF